MQTDWKIYSAFLALDAGSTRIKQFTSLTWQTNVMSDIHQLRANGQPVSHRDFINCINFEINENTGIYRNNDVYVDNLVLTTVTVSHAGANIEAGFEGRPRVHEQ